MRTLHPLFARLMKGMRLTAFVSLAVFAAALLYRVNTDIGDVGPMFPVIGLLSLFLTVVCGVLSLLAFAMARLMRPEEPGEI